MIEAKCEEMPFRLIAFETIFAFDKQLRQVEDAASLSLLEYWFAMSRP